MFRFCNLILFFIVNVSMLCYAASSRTLSLSLPEAILLALRDNPTVAISQLNVVQAKFSTAVAAWQFQPHYSFNATRTLNTGVVNGLDQPTSNAWSVTPAMSWQSTVGTQVSLASTNVISSHYNPGLSLQVMQPLMQGFGRPVVEAALRNTIDSETISRLNLINTLRTTVTAVINGYLQVVAAQNTLEVDQKALKRAQISVEQTKSFIKAGRKAGSELITVQANVANAETRIENDKNNLLQVRYALLAAIGVDPNSDIVFASLTIPALIHKYHVPSRAVCQALTLTNDIQYQVDQITLHGAAQRALLTAEDNTRPQLNVTVNSTVGQGSGGWVNSGINSLFNGSNHNLSASLNLTIPIDNQMLKQAVANAKIAIQQATLGLQQEKWNKETSAINGWNSIGSAERAFHYAEMAEKLQEKTYSVSLQKYQFGIIDSIALQSVQDQLIATGQALVNAEIAYLTALVNLDQLVGTTLKTWDIHIRYE